MTTLGKYGIIALKVMVSYFSRVSGSPKVQQSRSLIPTEWSVYCNRHQVGPRENPLMITKIGREAVSCQSRLLAWPYFQRSEQWPDRRGDDDERDLFKELEETMGKWCEL